MRTDLLRFKGDAAGLRDRNVAVAQIRRKIFRRYIQ